MRVAQRKINHRGPQQGGKGVPLRGAAFKGKLGGLITHRVCGADDTTMARNDELNSSNKRRSSTNGGKCCRQGRVLNCIKRRCGVQEGHMELLIMLTRVFVHVIDNFNRGFAGTALDEPKLVWVKQGMLVKETVDKLRFSIDSCPKVSHVCCRFHLFDSSRAKLDKNENKQAYKGEGCQHQLAVRFRPASSSLVTPNLRA